MSGIAAKDQVRIHEDVAVEIVHASWDMPDVTHGIDRTRRPRDVSGFKVIGRVIEDVFGDGYPHSRAVVLDEDGEFYMSPPVRASFFYDEDEDVCFYDDDEDVFEEEGEFFVAFRRVKPKISKVSVIEWRK